MDCRKFKDAIDSFLCGELLVETNLEMIRHSEHCPECRTELAARRNLAETLRRVGRQETMGEEAQARLRTRLRATEEPGTEADWNAAIRTFFAQRWMSAVAACLLMIAAGGYMMFRLLPQSVYAAELSEKLIHQATSEHYLCRAHVKSSVAPEAVADSAVVISPVFRDLDHLAAATGLQLRTAHRCGFEGRSFVHLGFTQGDAAISIMIVRRDAEAMKRGLIPVDNGLRAGMQSMVESGYNVAAYQSSRHVLLAVSKLPEAENAEIAKRLAEPICARLRQSEATGGSAADLLNPAR